MNQNNINTVDEQDILPFTVDLEDLARFDEVTKRQEGLELQAMLQEELLNTSDAKEMEDIKIRLQAIKTQLEHL